MLPLFQKTSCKGLLDTLRLGARLLGVLLLSDKWEQLDHLKEQVLSAEMQDILQMVSGVAGVQNCC